MPTLHVVIPFYNEVSTLQRCIDRVVTAPLHEGWLAAIVLVDDHSDDLGRSCTESVARQLRAQGRRLSLHRHEVNRGKGAAVVTGFDALLDSNPPGDDLVIIQDADLEYDPADYRRLMGPMLDGETDAVIGSRWGDHHPVAGAKHKLHAWGNRAITAVSNCMTGYRLRDMECCYKLLTVRMVQRVRPMLSEPRFGIEPQIVASLARLGAKVTEIPVSYDPRRIDQGKKIGWTDGVRALYVITRERFRRIPAAAPTHGARR